MKGTGRVKAVGTGMERLKGTWWRKGRWWRKGKEKGKGTEPGKPGDRAGGQRGNRR